MALRAPRTEISPRRLREDLNLSRERMGRLLDVSAKTIERWEGQDRVSQGRLVRERLATLQEVVDLGLTVYTREGLREFLTTPLPVFDGRSALQLVELGEGEWVLAVLAADYEGLGY